MNRRLFTDSQSALYAIMDNNCTHNLVASIHEKLFILRERGAQIHLNWTKAHVGTIGNEKADALAKAAAASQLPIFYQKVPLSLLKRELRDKAWQKWEERYQSETTGRGTKIFFPSVRDRQRFPNSYISFATTQAFTGHGAFAAYLKRFCLRERDECPCDGVSSQNIRHLLTECGYTFQERQMLEHVCNRFRLGARPILLIKPIIPTVVNVINRIVTKILPVVSALLDSSDHN